MALETTFRDMVIGLQRFKEDLGSALTTIQEDKPLHHEVALPDILSDLVMHILGLAEEATQAGIDAHLAVGGQGQVYADLNRARVALSQCQEQFNRMAYSYNADLMSYDRISELLRVGYKDRAWRAWAGSVKAGLEASRVALHEANDCLALCWGEIAERVGMSSFAVHNTTTGQNITLPGRGKDPAIAGLT